MEVNDNGSGIRSDDFDQLCKPHATSKLGNIGDFSSLTTFGFRGEALNALCALSLISITTRHKNEEVGTRLIFDHGAKIISKESCAWPVGTTVSVRSLFEPLPVRRKELERTIKKEFFKLLTTVHSTCLLGHVTNACFRKKHQALLSPGGNASIKDVIVSLFGARAERGAILEIVQVNPDEEVCSLYSVPPETNFDDIRLSGYISSCEHGHGRSSNDRQFIFFNKRPVHYPKLCRIANEVYQMYNSGQYCMLILFVEAPPGLIDVNVSPDKQMVYFEREKDLFALLRSSLLATFVPLLGCTQSVRTLNWHIFGSIFRKDDFERMVIIGQFNKGFIVTRLHGDLFIVDQHASDEKYNFERFQKKARIQSQALLRPLPLGLGAFDESLLQDHLEIFNYNGFEFQINEEGMIQDFRFNNETFGYIDEMLSVLREFPGTMYRPAKLRKLFALRACRKSVMIGTVLTTYQMEKNCPHGRPTVRHLCSLEVSKPSAEGIKIISLEEDKSRDVTEDCYREEEDPVK
ncbi:unnamed protein product [Enterobius vermicularis]|uniref:DNA mismatch repair protein Mlh3 n=1 Tax=Enterobius vermicularis TaxID=51028 RepID=A0A0N4UWS7_ENTVE|nr:unnamed protein product [Enterobius vermicularis]